MHLNLLSYNFYRHDGDYKPEKGETAKKILWAKFITILFHTERLIITIISFYVPFQCVPAHIADI